MAQQSNHLHRVYPSYATNMSRLDRIVDQIIFGAENAVEQQLRVVQFVWSSQADAPAAEEPDPEDNIALLSTRRTMFDNLPSRVVKKVHEPENTCSICLENFKKGEKITKLLCNHEIHSECLWPWMAQHNNCPVCRFDSF